MTTSQFLLRVNGNSKLTQMLTPTGITQSPQEIDVTLQNSFGTYFTTIKLLAQILNRFKPKKKKAGVHVILEHRIRK